MLSAQAVGEIHLALQAIFSDSLVLLGGSFWSGEAGESSDLDFYILRPLRRFFAYRRGLPEVRALKERYAGAIINCLVAPRFFYERGWYYAAGQTTNGEVWRSPLNTKIIHRTAIKLAYWNYILFLTAEEQAEKQLTLIKTAQQLAVAQTVLASAPPEKGLTTGFLIGHLPEDFAWNPVRKLLSTKQTAWTFSFPELEAIAAGLFSLAERLRAAHPRQWRFSFANYCVYNGKFLRRRNPLFLFSNPDKMIVDRLREGLRGRTDLIRLREEMRTIVFPVIMI